MAHYVRFCSCQMNAANLIQRKCEDDPKFVEVHKVSQQFYNPPVNYQQDFIEKTDFYLAQRVFIFVPPKMSKISNLGLIHWSIVLLYVNH